MEEQPIPTEDPVLRIWLCGPFEMAWVDPASGASQPIDPTTTGRDRGPALSLLKLLLCQPERQASRDWIMEQFWPEHSRSVATHRLENVFSRLRKLLTPPGGGESLLHSLRGKRSSGPSYGLDASPILWVDSDAAIWHVEQAARMERFGDDSLPFWQRAFALLSRGPFLADEPYATWVIEQRAVLDGDARQCVHALAHLYLAHYGEAGKAEALLLLRTYWQQHQTDEDALRPLMELLGEQERYQEAEEYYQHLRLALADLGPGEAGQPRTPDARTQDIHEYLCTKQIKRGNTMQSMPALQPRTIVLQGHRTAGNGVSQECDIHSISESSHPFTDDIINRRAAGKKIVTFGASILAGTVFDLIQVGTMLHDEELLAICATSLPILWRFYFDGHLSEIQRVLPGYLSQLALLSRQPSPYQQQAARLASKAHQLACMLALQDQDYGQALIHVDQALQNASRANDTHLKVASLIRKALVYRYVNLYLKKCSHQMEEAYEEAAQYGPSLSPLLRGRIYSGLCEAYSQSGRDNEARHMLEKAYEIFPETPEDDPHFAYTHFKLPQKFEAIMYLNLKQGRKAWDLLTMLESSIPATAVPDRVELLLDTTRASLLCGDLNACCINLELAVNAAIDLGSGLRYNEAYSIYKNMDRQWPHENSVQIAGQLFRS